MAKDAKIQKPPSGEKVSNPPKPEMLGEGAAKSAAEKLRDRKKQLDKQMQKLGL